MPKHYGYFFKNQFDEINHSVSKDIISEASFQIYTKQIDILNRLLPIAISFEAIKNNLEEINGNHELCVSTLSDVGDDIILLHNKSFYLLPIILKDINNYLSSASSFLKLTENFIKNNFGKESDMFIEWDTYRKDLHSNNFPYRFCYQLRNYSQHENLPTDIINFKVSDYPADANYVVKLIIHRTRLIHSSYDWNKNFISELKGMNHDFDLIELLPDYYSCLKKIFYKYLSFYEHSLYELINYINVKKSELNMSDNSLMVIFNSPSYGFIDGENNSLEYQVVPFPQINWLSNLFKEVKT